MERLAKEFTVLSEVGSKDNTRIMAPFRWVEQIQSELDAGAWKVIAEARESGSVGIFRHDGEVRMGLIDEIVHAIPPEKILFEAPRKDQQVWFIRRFGPDVNLGNIVPEEVLSLETMRVGLRSDTAVLDIDDVSGAGDGSRRAIVLARHGETNDNVEPIRVQGYRHAAQRHRPRPGARAGRALAASGRSRRCGPRTSAAPARRPRSSAPGSGSSRGSTPVCARPTAAAGRAGGSSRSSATSPSCTPPGGAAAPSLRFPGGESLLEQQQRVTACLTEIHAGGELPALAVCHGGTIRVDAVRSDPRGLDAFHDFDVPNMAVVPL